MSRKKPLRLFLDSNVLTGGILSDWGLDRAVLSLCAARICRMVLAEYVREEVENNLLARAADVPVLLSAMQSKPDCLLTHNTKHFTPQVAKRTGLQIGTPVEFFQFLSQSIS